MPMIFGISGKMAAGKSEILKILGRRGFFCISSDKITHALYASKQVGAKIIRKTFGEDFLRKSGEVDRMKLRSLVFSNPDAIKLLNKVMHPLITEEIKLLLKNKDLSKNEPVFIESVYFEKKFLGKFINKIIWIERPKKEILKTIVKSRGFDVATSKIVLGIVESPLKIDYIIRNNGNLNDLEAKVDKFLKYFSLV